MSNPALIDKIKRLAKLKRELKAANEKATDLNKEIDTLLEGLSDEDKQTAEKILDHMRQMRTQVIAQGSIVREINELNRDLFYDLED